MESLRRLRVVWFVLCCIAAAVLALAWFGGAPPQLLAAPLAGVVLLACASATRSWFSTLSCLWVGATFVVAGMAADKGTRGDVGSVIMFGGGGYILLAVAVWIVRPMLKGGARP